MQDKLWVPLLTHYRDGSPGRVDPDRTRAHLKAIRPEVAQVMLAGSTGDGWELDEAAFDTLINLAAATAAEDGDVTFLFGILRPTTAEVIARLRHLEGRLKEMPHLAERFRGVAICPPVARHATQAEILAHYTEIIETSDSPIAVYQLPQVTGCEIAPETFAHLAGTPRITMFKDSSGQDAVARSGRSFGSVEMVRGAEGGYLDALKPEGPYDGWLLSTGNAVATELRRILDLRGTTEAVKRSDDLSTVVQAVFDAARDEPGANAFSNANRAMDHLRAHGAEWARQPLPLKVDGSRLSRSLMETVERVAGSGLEMQPEGYEARR